jgi:hypothetical protein
MQTVDSEKQIGELSQTRGPGNTGRSFLPLSLMRKPDTALVSSGAMLVAVGAVAALVLISSSARRVTNPPYGRVVFIGYTNDHSGATLATFAITNASDVAVARAGCCVVAFEGHGGVWTPQGAFPLSRSFRRRVLSPGESEIVTVPTPPNLSPWRIEVFLSNDVGPSWPFRRMVNAACALVGRAQPYGWATMEIDSRRIDDH